MKGMESNGRKNRSCPGNAASAAAIRTTRATITISGWRTASGRERGSPFGIRPQRDFLGVVALVLIFGFAFGKIRADPLAAFPFIVVGSFPLLLIIHKNHLGIACAASAKISVSANAERMMALDNRRSEEPAENLLRHPSDDRRRIRHHPELRNRKEQNLAAVRQPLGDAGRRRHARGPHGLHGAPPKAPR